MRHLAGEAEAGLPQRARGGGAEDGGDARGQRALGHRGNFRRKEVRAARTQDDEPGHGQVGEREGEAAGGNGVGKELGGKGEREDGRSGLRTVAGRGREAGDEHEERAQEGRRGAGEPDKADDQEGRRGACPALSGQKACRERGDAADDGEVLPRKRERVDAAGFFEGFGFLGQDFVAHAQEERLHEARGLARYAFYRSDRDAPDRGSRAEGRGAGGAGVRRAAAHGIKVAVGDQADPRGGEFQPGFPGFGRRFGGVQLQERTVPGPADRAAGAGQAQGCPRRADDVDHASFGGGRGVGG